MAEVVHVVDKYGNEATVTTAWLERWPDDFTVVGEKKSAPSKGRKKTATAETEPGGDTDKEAS